MICMILYEFHYVKAWAGFFLFQLPQLRTHGYLLLALASPLYSYPRDNQ